jgi:hypothetical protein
LIRLSEAYEEVKHICVCMGIRSCAEFSLSEDDVSVLVWNFVNNYLHLMSEKEMVQVYSDSVSLLPF